MEVDGDMEVGSIKIKILSIKINTQPFSTLGENSEASITKTNPGLVEETGDASAGAAGSCKKKPESFFLGLR